MLPTKIRPGTGCASSAAVVVSILVLGSSLAAQPATWSVEPDLEIGEATTPDYSLSPVNSLDLDQAGRVFVGQPMDRQIRVYSPEGRFLEVIGGRGGGPGEFQNIAAFGVLGDSIWVSDLSQERLTWFSLEGELLRTLPWHLQFGDETQPGVPEAILQTGGAVASPKMHFTRREDDDARELPVYLVDSNGLVLRKLVSLDVHKRFLTMSYRGGRRISPYQPLRDTPLVESTADGSEVVVLRRPVAEAGDPARFTITFHAPDGDSIGAWRVRYRPVPVTDEQVAQYVDRASKRLIEGRARLPEADAEKIARDALYLPDFHPPVSKMVVGRDGTIWLRRERTGDRDRWEAYGRGGERLGRVSVEHGTRVLAAEARALWAARRTAAGVPQVVRLAIDRKGEI